MRLAAFADIPDPAAAPAASWELTKQRLPSTVLDRLDDRNVVILESILVI